MSKKLISISIFVLMAIFCACGFTSLNYTSRTIYATGENIVDCYTLIERDAINNTKSTYISNSVVGNMNGTGYYMVGQTANLLVRSDENYHVAGFKIIYLDQGNRTEHVWLENNNEIIHNLSYDNAYDNTMLITKVKYAPITSSERASEVNVQISRVGENLQVTPIFDHLYGRIQIDNSALVLEDCDSVTIDSTTLYYSSSMIEGDVTVYNDAYVEIDYIRYYYGIVLQENEILYTIHSKQDSGNSEEKIPLSVGAFRQNETVNLTLAVDDYYDVWDVQVLRNVQFASELQNGSINIYKTAEQNTSHIGFENFNIGFNTSLYSNLELSIKAHKLHKVEVKFLVDGEVLEVQHYDDFFGEVTIEGYSVKANVSSSNYFNAFENITVNGKNYPTEYFIKSASNNNNKSFNIQGVQEIIKVQDGFAYTYYTFEDIELDGVDQGRNSLSFNEPTNDVIEISIKYSAVEYNISFEYREKQGDNLVDFEGEAIDLITLRRGESVKLGIGSGANNIAQDIIIDGYQYAGLSLNRNNASDVEDDLVVTIDEQKPADMIVYVVFEKVEYTVVFTGLNTINLRGVYAINNLQFDISGEKETFINDTVLTTYTLANKVKITQILSVEVATNTGLCVEFSLAQDGSMPIESLEITAEVLELIAGNTLNVYVIESFKTYTLEYVTQSRYDENIRESVIMANLSAEKVDVLNTNLEISTVQEVLDDGDNVVANKIIISGLYYGDKIRLNSSGKTQTTGETYTYIFNKFYKGQVTNTLTYGEDNYTHTQVDVCETIYVVYGLPRVVLEIEWTLLTQSDFSYTVSDSTGVLEPIEGADNEFKPSVGETVTVTISNIKFGYELIKYNFNDVDNNIDEGLISISVTIGPNINRLVLCFSLKSYRFIFAQWGEEFNGENYEFSGVCYHNMTVDNRSTIINLPEGMYVEKASVEGNNLNRLFGTDKFTQNSSTTDITYLFDLTLEQFENLVSHHSSTDANGQVVIINLTYKKHEFSIIFELEIDGLESEFSSTIAAPTIVVMDGDENTIASNNNVGNPKQEYTGIKYGTNIALIVGEDLKPGLKFNKWDCVGNITSVGDREIVITKMSSNVVVKYIVVCVPHTISLYNYSGNGVPDVSVKGINGSTIKLFDSMTINPNPYSGIRVKAIRNISLYNYNASTWSADYESLFYRENGEILPATNTYDGSKLYFYEEKILQTSMLGGNLIYIDELFDTENYFISTVTKGLQTKSHICIYLEYEYIQYKVTHSVNGLDENWLEMFDNNPIHAFGVGGEELDFTKTYNKNDSLNYVFRVSSQANIGDLSYNLTNNVTLKSITINDKPIPLPVNESGTYTIIFNIENYIPTDDSEEIIVVYQLQTTEKKLIVKTQIEEDTSGNFKNNLEFQIGKENQAIQSTNGKLKVEKTFEYLTNLTTINAQFNKKLKDAFEFGEVQIYLGNSKKALTASECEALGITIERNNSKAVTNIKYRLDNDITCVFIVRPKIDGFQSGTKFSKEFKCDSSGNGIAQPLTVGENKEINISSEFQVNVEYTNSFGNKVNNPTDVGVYEVIISFNGEGWMAQIGNIGSAILEITPKVITAMYNTSATKKTKVYNGSSDYYMSADEINDILFDFKSFTDGQQSKVAYSVVKNWTNNAILLNSSKISAFSTTGGELGKVSNANESAYYNLYVQGLVINSSNFSLSSSMFEIPNYIQIKKAPISLVNVNVKNKVYDDTTTAKIQQRGEKAIDVVGEIEGEQLIINVDLLTVNFEDKEVGINKKVKVNNIRKALTEINCDASNYIIEDSIEVTTTAGIYPYKITKNIEGLGEVSIVNVRGLNSDDDNLITLIPINSRIDVKIIYQDSQEYRNLYRVFGKNVRGNNEFAIGYTFKLVSNETVQDISKELYVQVPNIKHITGAYYLTGQSSGKIGYEQTTQGILIDLQSLSVDLDKLMFTQQRILLKVWQIILIVITFILLLVSVVLLIIIIRRRKKKDYSVHEKI